MLNKVVSARDLSGAGYGNIPKLVMTDTRLSLEAKAMYAYICVYSGVSYSATPDKKTAMYHLNISSNSYAKYGAELEGIGYITRKRMYKDGKFDGVRFLLSKEITDNGPAAPDTKISDTVASPRTKISDTLDSHTKFSDTINSQTNNPSPILGTVVNTPCVYQSISRAYTHETVTDDREIDVTHHEVLQEIVAYGSLPYAYCFHRAKLEAALDVLTDFEKELATDNTAERQLYKLFVSALVDMLDANTADTVIKGAKLSYAKIFEALVPAIEVGYTELDEPYAVAFELYAGVKRRYEAARAQTPIKRPISYMKAVIWTELTTAEVEIQDQFAYDFGGKT